MEYQAQDPVSALLSEFGTRLNEIEEKQRIIKDRILLIGENLISTKEDFLNQEINTKKQLKQLVYEVESIKQLLKRILNEISNFARKAEVEILERQLKIFSPLEFARISDIKEIVKEELSKQLKINKS